MQILIVVAIIAALFAAYHFHLLATVKDALHKHSSAPSTAASVAPTGGGVVVSTTGDVTVHAGNSSPPAPSAGSASVNPSPSVTLAGFASAPNENGYVQLTQVEADRAKYANDPDPAYRYWAKTVPHWYAIDDTLKAFTLSDAQRKKLVADLNQATVLLAMQGAGEWYFNVAANLPDSAAFSDGGFRPDIAGVHLRNLAEALAHQRAHVKAINPDGLDTVAPVAGPTHPGAGAGGPGHGAEAGK